MLVATGFVFDTQSIMPWRQALAVALLKALLQAVLNAS
jgi:hypothetical protein